MTMKLCLLAVLATTTLVVAIPPSGHIAPLHVPDAAPHDLINNSYIVMFKEDVKPSAFAAHMGFLEHANTVHPLAVDDDNDGSAVGFVYNSFVAKGYAGRLSQDALEMIRHRPEVEYVEQEQYMYGDTIQQNSPWGLARVSHRPKLGSKPWSYLYNENAGKGVTVYVVDSGVYIDHPEFEGRARWGGTFVNGDGDVDVHGHGSHCAGTVASRKFGVAKHAEIVAVKVLHGAANRGPTSGIIKGIEWAAQDAQNLRLKAAAELKATGRTAHKGSVANISIGGSKSQALNSATDNAIKSGLHVAVSAGNDNRDACLQSPASAELPIVVGATTLVDKRASFSNYGKCVDVFAPGYKILSTWKKGEYSHVDSGTSMSTPHVAGLLAYFLSIYEPSSTVENPEALSSVIQTQLDAESSYSTIFRALRGFASRLLPLTPLSTPAPQFVIPSPAFLKQKIIRLATPGLIDASTLPKGSPNLLAFNGRTGNSFDDEIEFE